MNKNISEYREIINTLKISEKNLKKGLDKCKSDAIMLNRDANSYEKARDIVNTVLELTQEQTKQYIEELVTLAISSVFGDEYALEISYEQKRGRSECVLQIRKGDLLLDPRSEIGGGLIDILALSLRIIVWSLKTEENKAKVFILDEPAKHLSVGLRPKFGELLKEFSNMFNVQLLVVSHDKELIDSADKVFEVVQEENISKIYEGVS